MRYQRPHHLTVIIQHLSITIVMPGTGVFCFVFFLCMCVLFSEFEIWVDRKRVNQETERERNKDAERKLKRLPDHQTFISFHYPSLLYKYTCEQ